MILFFFFYYSFFIIFSFHNILQWNCNGFYAHIAELKLIIYELDPFILCIQESRFKPNHTPTLNGYNCVFHNHDNFNNASGGVLICIKSEFQYVEIDLNTHIQAVAIEIFFPIRFSICNIYLPPNQIIAQTDIESLINQLPKPFILLGDMNAHSPVWGSYKQNVNGKLFENILLNSGLICLNNGSPTRFNPFSTVLSSIDLSITTPNLMIKTEWSTLDDLHHSDHYPIIIKLLDHKNNVTRRPKWIIQKADWSEYYRLTGNVSEFSDDIDINQQVKHLTDTIINAANLTIPSTSDNISRRTVPWWNDSVKLAIHTKRKMLKIFKRSPTQDNLLNYNRAKAKARQSVLESKKKSWRDFVSTITDETPLSVVFKKISKISGIYKSNNVASIIVNDRIITDTQIILRELGTTLSEISSSENYAINFMQYKQQSENIVLNLMSNNTEPYNSLFSIEELNSSLKKCKGSSPGPDNVHYDMIKHLHAKSVTSFLNIINTIWVDHVFPDSWRNAFIIPILKPGKPSTCTSSYRPISLTSCLVKVFEGMVNTRLTYILENQNYFHNLQYGFRKRRSTMDPLVTLESEIQDAFISKKHCVVVFFDIRRAYDMVWRYSIIRNLYNFGIRGNLLFFLENFTKDRTFQVLLGNSSSELFNQENGIPQGSKISVTLFLIAINNILDCIRSPVKALLYADDLTIYTSHTNITKAQQLIQTAINELSKWSIYSGFQFAAEKMSVVHFHRFRSPQPAMSIFMNSIQITQNDSHKLLGVWFDGKLTFKKHIDQLYVNCIKRSNILKILSNQAWGSDENVLLTIYKSIIRSKLEYGCAVYGSAKPKLLHKLQIIQNMCLRLITGAYRSSPVISLHALTGVMPLNYRTNQYILTISNNICSSPLHPLYKSITEPNSLRSKYAAKKYCTKSFSFRAQSLLHSLNINPYINPTTIFRTFPPWTVSPIHIDTSLTILQRNQTSTHEYRRAFIQALDKFPNNNCIYTDGSLVGNNVGCAFICNDVKFQFHLPNNCSISTAELYAIYKAVIFTHSNLTQDTLIITDSLSSIQCLVDPYSNNYIVQNIHKHIIQKSSPKLCFMWVPSHQGIPGNEEVDKYAKDSLNCPLSDIDIPMQNMKTNLKHLNTQTWNTEWEVTQFNKLRNIKNTTTKLLYTHTITRKTKIILNRLLIGHCNLTHQYLFKKDLPPICSTCDTRLSVEHFLLHCTAYTNPKPGSDIKNILGKTDETAVKLLLKYLNDNNLMNKI